MFLACNIAFIASQGQISQIILCFHSLIANYSLLSFTYFYFDMSTQEGEGGFELMTSAL
jgi:hypothetical protein